MLNKEKLNANPVGVAAHSDPQTNKTTKFNCRGGRLCPPANKQKRHCLNSPNNNNLFSYDENVKSSNNKGFLLQTI